MKSAEPIRPPRLTSREGSREEPGSRARRVYGGGAPRNFVDLSPRCRGTDDSKEGRTNERFERLSMRVVLALMPACLQPILQACFLESSFSTWVRGIAGTGRGSLDVLS